jgi:hypothetical protein
VGAREQHCRGSRGGRVVGHDWLHLVTGVVGDDDSVSTGSDAGVEHGDEGQTDGGAEIWAPMNPGTEPWRCRAKVSKKIRPMGTAGLANEVELVNQYTVSRCHLR